MVFTASFALIVYYALREGSYDVIARHEEALVLWSLLALGFAFGLLPRGRLGPAVAVPTVAVAGLAALTLISLSWTESDERTALELSRVLHYAGLVTLALVALNRHTWRAAAAGLSAGALAVCAVAVGSRLAPGTFPDDEIARLLQSDRLSYPLDYWNGVAAWGAMAVAMALAWSAHARLPVVRAAALGLVPVAALTVYLTYSRTGVIGVGVAILAVHAFSHNRWTAAAHSLAAGAGSAIVILVARGEPAIAEGTGGEGGTVVAGALLAAGIGCAGVALATSALRLDRARLPHRQGRLAAAAAAVLAILVVAGPARGEVTQAWDEFKNQRNVAGGATQRLTSAGGNRYDVWSSAFDAFSAEPAQGIGPGTFEFWWSRTADNPEFLRDAHSLYLEQLAELGLPGLLLTLAFLGGLGAAAILARARLERDFERGAAAAMIAALCVFLVHAGVDWMWELTAVSALALGAIAAAAAGLSRRDEPGLPTAARVAVVAVAVGAALAQMPGLVSTARVRESADTLAAGDAASAHRLADEAIAAQPWAAEPYVQRATVAELQGRLGAARADLRQAIEKEPTNWRQRILLAQVELKRGDIASAREAFADAKRLHRFSTLYFDFDEFRLRVESAETDAETAD